MTSSSLSKNVVFSVMSSPKVRRRPGEVGENEQGQSDYSMYSDADAGSTSEKDKPKSEDKSEGDDDDDDNNSNGESNTNPRNSNNKNIHNNHNINNSTNNNNNNNNNNSSGNIGKKTSRIVVKKNSSSKYDFVKVKVYITAERYYVTPAAATLMALDLKKDLVRQGLLEVSHKTTEDHLFDILQRNHYGKEYLERYQMMSRFHHERVGLIVLICGPSKIGKSTLATRLGERLNISTVLQTDIVYELMDHLSDSLAVGEKEKKMKAFEKEQRKKEKQKDEYGYFLKKYKEECKILRRGVEADINKALHEGKNIIIEGRHVDPSCYLDAINSNKGVIVPFILCAKSNDQIDRVRTSCFPTDMTPEQVQKMFIKDAIMQKYLVETVATSRPETFLKVECDVNNQAATLDLLHDIILNRIAAYFAAQSTSTTTMSNTPSHTNASSNSTSPSAGSTATSSVTNTTTTSSSSSSTSSTPLFSPSSIILTSSGTVPNILTSPFHQTLHLSQSQTKK